MKTKILNVLFMVLIAILFIFLIAIILINVFEEEESNVGGLTDITGAMQSFEVYHNNIIPTYIDVKTTGRYDNKLFEYLEHLQEQRDKTFMRGRVFLREK